MRKLRPIGPAWLVICCTAFAAALDVALISNKANHADSISVYNLAKICKGQNPRWPDGKPVTFIMRAPATPQMKLVVEKVYAMPKDEVAALIANAHP